MLSRPKLSVAQLNVIKPSTVKISDQEETIETLRELLGEHIEEVGRLIAENNKLRAENLHLRIRLSEYEES